MEGELKSVVEVSMWVAVSMTYARFASARIPPGRGRLLALLPVLCLLPRLPLSFSTVHLRGISAFFLAWLAVFKLLLLSFGLGPISPSLPLVTFVFTASLPVKLRPPNKSAPPNPNRRLLSFAVRATLLAALTSLYIYKHRIHHYLLLTIYGCHFYLTLELVLASAAFLAGALLGMDHEPQFDEPYRTTSLQDFWGRRWNLMVTGILRPSVYGPVSARWGKAASVMATFLLSGLMHELIFYYVTLSGPTGGVTFFFVLHGLCIVAEARAKQAGWRPHAAVAGPLTIGFIVITAFWLILPTILRSGMDERVLEECAVVMGLLEDGGRALTGLVLNQPQPGSF